MDFRGRLRERVASLGRVRRMVVLASLAELRSCPTASCHKKNEAPCGLLFRAALQLQCLICVSYLSSLVFQAFPSYPPCR